MKAPSGPLSLEQAGMGLGHAMAQALGGHFGLPQGSMNALTLPVALEFNEPAAPWRSPASASPAQYGRRSAYANWPVWEASSGCASSAFWAWLHEVAADVVQRAGARANPRPASAGEVEELLRTIW